MGIRTNTDVLCMMNYDVHDPEMKGDSSFSNLGRVSKDKAHTAPIRDLISPKLANPILNRRSNS